MNKFDLEFMNGYIKTSLRLARKIKRAKTLDEAMQKMEKTVAYI
jgi:hypothetical protein